MINRISTNYTPTFNAQLKIHGCDWYISEKGRKTFKNLAKQIGSENDLIDVNITKATVREWNGNTPKNSSTFGNYTTTDNGKLTITYYSQDKKAIETFETANEENTIIDYFKKIINQ